MHVALIAHDRQKPTLIEFVRDHEAILGECDCIATGTTGKRLNAETDLEVERVASGPLGGDVMIGAEVVKGNCDAVIFLRNPLIPHPHEPDIAALVRICDVHDVPLATNLSSAHAILYSLTERRVNSADRTARATREGGQRETITGGKSIGAALAVTITFVAIMGISYMVGLSALSVIPLAVGTTFAIALLIPFAILDSPR